jgi:tRNA modification GTPase
MEGTMSAADTIVAIATAPGRAAVGIVRVSGPAAARIATAVLGAVPAPRIARFCRFRGSDGSSIDEGLALYFPAPRSFTGEDVLELQGHGGNIVLASLVARLIELGCRGARPGEFSERAFHNGKLDMAQAEAVADLIDAGTLAAARAAVRSLQGEFSTRIRALQGALTELRKYTEAALDFSDEQIDFLSDSAFAGRLDVARGAGADLLAGARQGALLRTGITVVIAGAPNVGKSSLLNRLAGDEIAIVSDLPGTTRDLLKQPVHLDGLPLTLIDTAGLRDGVDRIEAEGIRRARNEIARADHVLHVVEAGAGAVLPDSEIDEVPLSVQGAAPITRVVNKIDLTGELPRVEQATDGSGGSVYVSARTGAGIDLLVSHLTKRAGYEGADGGAFGARARHVEALTRALEHLDTARESIAAGAMPELVAEELRLAQRNLSEITGEVSSDDLLGEIFGSFCIGK